MNKFLVSGRSAEQAIIPDPTPMGPINYINPEIPEIQRPEYPGKYYDALVPATLDLAELGRLAINAFDGMLNPNTGAHRAGARARLVAHGEDHEFCE